MGSKTPIITERADGTKTYKYQWYEKGLPGRQGRTFDDLHSWKTFKRLVEISGRRGEDRYPGDEVMIRHGLLKPSEVARIDAEANPPAAPVVTIAEALERFIAFKENEVQRRPTDRTLKEYRSLLANYVAGSSIADLDVATVMAKPITAWVGEQKRRESRRTGQAGKVGISNSSMNKVLSLLSSMFKWSTMTKSDPDPRGEKPLRMIASPMPEVDHFRIGKDRKREKRVLEKPDEYATFFRLAYEVDPFWADMIVISALTGMRFGEVTAITVGQVAPRKGVIDLDRRFSAGVPELGTKGSSSAEAGYVVSREARVPANVIGLLEACCKGKSAGDLVFDGPDFSMNRRWVASIDNRRWKALDEKLIAADLYREMRHHHLRHSLTTYLRDQGVLESLVKAVVGHTDPSVTARYLHMTEESWRVVLAVIEPLGESVMQLRTAAHAAYGPRRVG